MLKKIIRICGLAVIIGISCFMVIIPYVEKDVVLMDSRGDSSLIKQIVVIQSFFEDRFYDYRMQFSLKKNYQDKNIVLAEINDEALNKIGRWPWSRSVWGDILAKLKKFGAKVVVFDVLFSEPEKSCDKNSPDTLMANAIKDFQGGASQKVIIGYGTTNPKSYFNDPPFKDIPDSLLNFLISAQVEGTPAEGTSVGSIDKTDIYPKAISSTNYPIPELLAAEPGLGLIDAREDDDGIYRHYPVLANAGNSLYFPSMALLAYQYYTGDTPQLTIKKNVQDITLQMKTGVQHLNQQGEFKVRWAGGREVFPVIGLYQLTTAKLDDAKVKQLLQNKIVFIASTAFANHDIRHTAIDAKMPGVYFHMNALNAMLNGRFSQSPDKSLLWSWGILAAGTIIMILVSLLANAIIDVSFMLLLCVGTFFLDILYLIPKGYQINLFFALLPIFGTYLWNTLINFYLSNKDKRFLKNAFGSYISPELIDEMHKSGRPPHLGGDVSLLTAFFTDIQGFSTFSEKLSAPRLVELLNEYLTVMTDILLEHRGTLDKYEGDAIIAFFGAPLPLPDHAIKSCQVALKMQAALAQLRKKWSSEGDRWPTFVHNMRMRIGINSGEIVTGNMGSRSRMNYTMMGDAVNLAARLEAAAKQYGVFVQLSQFTKSLTSELFEMRELDTVCVVGKSEPVTTFDLLGEKGNTAADLLSLRDIFHQGLALYKQQQWDQAIATFEQALVYEHKRYPELAGKINPSSLYIQRCKEFKINPPAANWDGICTLTVK
ncbi:MAG: CHASE2 domain-containing protein [Oligoflexia bacterium]|nr:CHASE2 domain-containing protein [Oligoflexia bacterium]